jgi:hypothetical protein
MRFSFPPRQFKEQSDSKSFKLDQTHDIDYPTFTQISVNKTSMNILSLYFKSR